MRRSEKTEIGARCFIVWLEITASNFYDWRERYGKANEHTGWVPCDFWLGEREKHRRVFIGYSHADRKWLERLQVHLRPLMRDSNVISFIGRTRYSPDRVFEERQH